MWMCNVTCKRIILRVTDSCHVWMSHATFEWVMSHVNESRYVWMPHVTMTWQCSDGMIGDEGKWGEDRKGSLAKGEKRGGGNLAIERCGSGEENACNGWEVRDKRKIWAGKWGERKKGNLAIGWGWSGEENECNGWEVRDKSVECVGIIVGVLIDHVINKRHGPNGADAANVRLHGPCCGVCLC